MPLFQLDASNSTPVHRADIDTTEPLRYDWVSRRGFFYVNAWEPEHVRDRMAVDMVAFVDAMTLFLTQMRALLTDLVRRSEDWKRYLPAWLDRIDLQWTRTTNQLCKVMTPGNEYSEALECRYGRDVTSVIFEWLGPQPQLLSVTPTQLMLPWIDAIPVQWGRGHHPHSPFQKQRILLNQLYRIADIFGERLTYFQVREPVRYVNTYCMLCGTEPNYLKTLTLSPWLHIGCCMICARNFNIRSLSSLPRAELPLDPDLPCNLKYAGVEELTWPQTNQTKHGIPRRRESDRKQ